jgi:hypothetical protein
VPQVHHVPISACVKPWDDGSHWLPMATLRQRGRSSEICPEAVGGGLPLVQVGPAGPPERSRAARVLRWRHRAVRPDAVPGLRRALRSRQTAVLAVAGARAHRRARAGWPRPAGRRRLRPRHPHAPARGLLRGGGRPGPRRVGDKTGNRGHGTSNDIAIAWPASGSPIVVAIMSDRGSADASSDDALIADATRAGVAALR